MAFFLLMWLLGSTTKGDLKGIADYFKTPLKVALSGGRGAGDSSSRDPGRRQGPDAHATARVKKGDDAGAARRPINLQAAQAELERAESAAAAGAEGQDRGGDRRQPDAARSSRTRCCSTSPPTACASRSSTSRTGRCSTAAAPSCKPYTREILHEIGKRAERRAQPDQPGRPHRRRRLTRRRRAATATGSCRPTAPTRRAAS